MNHTCFVRLVLGLATSFLSLCSASTPLPSRKIGGAFSQLFRPQEGTQKQQVSAPFPAPSTESSILSPSNGIVDYIGKTEAIQWSDNDIPGIEPKTKSQRLLTSFNLWRQYPWKKFDGKGILKLKIGGDLSLDSSRSSFSFGGEIDLEPLESLQDLTNVFNYATHDPRIEAVLIEMGRFSCGYAKLIELRRMIEYFRKSGKSVVGYCENGAEKELFLSLSFDEFYIPPDGGIDLRGFTGGATFLRGLFDKIGIEPQVQRIGKYKSFGDTFQRGNISEAQREVISSLLVESSNYWALSVASALNKTTDEVKALWADYGVKNPYNISQIGLVTGVRYLDQVEDMVLDRYTQPLTKWQSFLVDKLNNSIANTIEEMKSLTSHLLKNNSDISLSVTSTNIFSAQTDFDLQSEFQTFPRRRRSPRRTLPPAAFPSTTTADDAPCHASSANYTSIENLQNRTSVADEKTVNVFRKRLGKLKFLNSLRKGFVECADKASLLPAGLYAKKMRKGGKLLTGLSFREVQFGPRIAVVNAVGGIASGKSGNGPNGRSLGSDTLIRMIRSARDNPSVKAIVMRVDSPGGSALASDLMWREIRVAARKKPVIASMVDVAASGGYYIAMACDEIVAEDLTVTGSIGVVTAKFNAEKLNEKLGLSSETLSIGRYAEVFSSSRGFTEDESRFFEDSAQQAYRAFVTKAAASRNMSYDALHEVAQGRVWTGRQALGKGLVDHIGGLWKALSLAAEMADLPVNKTISYDVIRAPRSGLPFPFGSRASVASIGKSNALFVDDEDVKSPLLLLDLDISTAPGLAGADALGIGSLVSGINPTGAYLLRHTGVGKAFSAAFQYAAVTMTTSASTAASMTSPLIGFFADVISDEFL